MKKLICLILICSLPFISSCASQPKSTDSPSASEEREDKPKAGSNTKEAKQFIENLLKKMEADQHAASTNEVTYFEMKATDKGFEYSLNFMGGEHLIFDTKGELDQSGWQLSRELTYNYCYPPTNPSDYCEEAQLKVTYDSKTHKSVTIEGFYSQTDPMTQEPRLKMMIKDLASFKKAVKKSGDSYLKPYLSVPVDNAYLKPMLLDRSDEFY